MNKGLRHDVAGLFHLTPMRPQNLAVGQKRLEDSQIVKAQDGIVQALLDGILSQRHDSAVVVYSSVWPRSFCPCMRRSRNMQRCQPVGSQCAMFFAAR